METVDEKLPGAKRPGPDAWRQGLNSPTNLPADVEGVIADEDAASAYDWAAH